MERKEIPLAEYDTSPAMIRPDFEKLPLRLPERAVFAFLGERRLARFAEEHHGRVAGTFISITKNFPVWEIETEKGPVALMQAPVGAPAAVLMLERLFAYGAEKVAALGCCGALAEIPENTIFTVTRAFRDEGTSYHYLPPARFIDLDTKGVETAREVLAENGIPAADGVTWTTDAFFRETKEKIAARRAEGCNLCDMECAALAACAAWRKKSFAQLLFTADTLAGENHDGRGWGKMGRGVTLEMGVKVVLKM